MGSLHRVPDRLLHRQDTSPLWREWANRQRNQELQHKPVDNSSPILEHTHLVVLVVVDIVVVVFAVAAVVCSPWEVLFVGVYVLRTELELRVDIVVNKMLAADRYNYMRLAGIAVVVVTVVVVPVVVTVASAFVVVVVFVVAAVLVVVVVVLVAVVDRIGVVVVAVDIVVEVFVLVQRHVLLLEGLHDRDENRLVQLGMEDLPSHRFR